MGFRRRKSFKLGGGFRINLSKSGIGYSWGRKGVRITKRAKGGLHSTISVPGTGLSYFTKLTGGGKKSKSSITKAAKRRTATNASREAVVRDRPIKKTTNPPKPPKSSKVYMPCGIIMAILGVLALFVFWPFGVLATAIGIYYITCGPKIYADAVAKYKEVHPDFKEND